MANHCWNYAEFSGEEKKLKQLLASLEKTRQAFIETERALHNENVLIYALNGHMILGTPPPKQKPDGSYDIDAYTAYGSRWFDCEWDIQHDEGVLIAVTLQGSSAWSPMLPFFEKICKRMKLECHGNYEESGMDFAGEFEIGPDGIYEHTQMSYREYEAENNPDQFWENMVENIEEGYFDTIEDVYIEFTSCKWELTPKEKEELKEIHDKWLKTDDGKDK
jgi:hypothetical protein